MYLCFRISFTYEITTIDYPALEQAPVACQYDPLVLFTDGGNLGIAEIIFVEAVKAEQPQIARQASQIRVDDEARTEIRLVEASTDP